MGGRVMTDDLTAHNREDGKVVIQGDNPNAWMVIDPDIIMTDEKLESQSHPPSRTDVDDWEPK